MAAHQILRVDTAPDGSNDVSDTVADQPVVQGLLCQWLNLMAIALKVQSLALASTGPTSVLLAWKVASLAMHVCGLVCQA